LIFAGLIFQMLPTSHTRTLAIIGDPIEHSLTPLIQNAAWQHLRDSEPESGGDFVNVAFRVEPQNLECAVRGAQALGLLGLMVTIPHKQNVLALCDELDASAQLIGAANLLQFRADGKIIGHSSDGWAAIKSRGEQQVLVPGKHVCILGGGGAARSLALTFAIEGAREIVILNRTCERAQTIADEVVALGKTACAAALDGSTLREVLPECDLLVNATSVGMHPHETASPLAVGVLPAQAEDAASDAATLEAQLLHSGLAVYDIVYNPLETQLLRSAKIAGARAVDGLGMLIYTNVYAAQVCAGRKISPTVMRQAALAALAKKQS
jgi:shikimate dehydrogenase